MPSIKNVSAEIGKINLSHKKQQSRKNDCVCKVLMVKAHIVVAAVNAIDFIAASAIYLSEYSFIRHTAPCAMGESVCPSLHKTCSQPADIRSVV